MLLINDYMIATFNKNVKNTFGILNRDYKNVKNTFGILNRDYDNKGNFFYVNSNFYYWELKML